MTEIEKRDHERYAIELQTKLTVLPDADGQSPWQTITLETKNISSSGAFFEPDQLLDKGALLDIDLSLPFLRNEGGIEKNSTIRIKGEVVRMAPDGVAVRFVGQYQFIAK